MPRTSKILAIAAGVGLLAVGTLAYYQKSHSTIVSMPQYQDQQVIYLDQAWSREDRNTFYWISQGTVMMS